MKSTLFVLLILDVYNLKIIQVASLHKQSIYFILFLDVDECSLGTFNCSAGGMCINTEGSYNCSCSPGYSGDGQLCTGEISFSFVTLETKRKLGLVSSRSGLRNL